MTYVMGGCVLAGMCLYEALAHREWGYAALICVGLIVVFCNV